MKPYIKEEKGIITDELLEGHAFGNFLLNNGEAGEKLKARVQDFIDEFYKEGNNTLVVAGDKIRDIKCG